VTILSYAQNFEDVMLWRALKGVANGYYIDIGAHDPRVDSVSRLFYEQGWRGMHVEPLPVYCNALRDDRRDETVLQAAVGARAGVICFYEIPETGISTGDAQIAAAHRERGFPINEIVVPCVTLKQVFEQTKVEVIHWLKIDVEGLEEQVLQSWGGSLARPWVVVIESTLPLTQQESHEKWEHHLTSRGYHFAYFDGLNRFYLAQGKENLRAAFKVGPNVFDEFALEGHASASFCVHLNEIRKKEVQAFDDQLNSANHLAEAVKHQLSDVHDDYTKRIQVISDDSERVRVETEQRERSLAQKTSERLQQAHQEAEVRQQALRQQAGEALEKARLEAQAHLQMLVEREQVFSIKLEASQNKLILSQREAEEQQKATNKRSEEDLRMSRLEAHGHLQKLIRREQELSAQIVETQRQARTEAQDNLQLLAHRAAEFSKELQTRQIQADHLKGENRQREQDALRKWEALQLQSAAVLTETLMQHEADLATLRAAFEVTINEERESMALLASTLTAAHQQLNALQDSFIWRISKPLRALPFFSIKTVIEPVTVQKLSQLNPVLHETTLNASVVAPLFPPLVNSSMSAPLPITIPEALPAVQSLNDLLTLRGDNFIHYAYLTILGRAPDTSGLDYYRIRIDKGFSQIGLLMQLRRSKEGVRHNVSILGLDEAIKQYQRGQWFLIGNFLRRKSKTEGDDSIERKLRTIENNILAILDKNQERFLKLDNAIETLRQEMYGNFATATNLVQPSAHEKTTSPEQEGLKQLSHRARVIYFQLKSVLATDAKKGN